MTDKKKTIPTPDIQRINTDWLSHVRSMKYKISTDIRKMEVGNITEKKNKM